MVSLPLGDFTPKSTSQMASPASLPANHTFMIASRCSCSQVSTVGRPEKFSSTGKGVWGGGYLKLAAHWRQYLPLVSDRLVLAYHLAYQGTLAGETPFYMLPVIYTLYLRQTGSEGLGGLNTVRGLIQNRL